MNFVDMLLGKTPVLPQGKMQIYKQQMNVRPAKRPTKQAMRERILAAIKAGNTELMAIAKASNLSKTSVRRLIALLELEGRVSRHKTQCHKSKFKWEIIAL